jgi:hypothetical protein
LESLFRHLLEQLEVDTDFAEALEKSTSLPDSLKKSLRGNIYSVRMSDINRALLDSAFRSSAWSSLGLPPETPFPYMPGDLLYGNLSAEIHSPSLTEVYLTEEDASSNLSRFFVAAAAVVKRRVVVYSEASAAWHKQRGNA